MPSNSAACPQHLYSDECLVIQLIIIIESVIDETNDDRLIRLDDMAIFLD